MATSAWASYPYAEIEFHTATQLYAVSRGGGWANIHPNGDLISVQTQKSMDDPVGTWQVTLTGARSSDGMDWYDRLTENDMVVIKMGRPPQRMATVMVGLVDEVRRQRTMNSDGTPQQQVLVRGSDFAKILTRAMLRFYPELANDPSVNDNSFYKTAGGWQAMFNFFMGSDMISGKPADMIKQAVFKMLFRIMNMSFKYWDSSKGVQDAHLVNILRYQLADTPHIIPFLLTMVDYEGAFWNFIERVSISPFNELWLDTRGYTETGYFEPDYMLTNDAANSGYNQAEIDYMKARGIPGDPSNGVSFGEDNAYVMLYLRNTPFYKDQWDRLVTHTISYEDVLNEDLGRSDQENYNTFVAYNSLSVPSSTNLQLLVKPVMDQTNAQQYGMNPLEIQIEGISVDDGKLNDSIAAAQTLSKTLYDWYHLNKDYTNGTVQVKGSGFYKIGQRLCIQKCRYNSTSKTWEDLYFYIEAVEQDFQLWNSWTWTTTLTLTRGQTESMVPAPPAPPPPPPAPVKQQAPAAPSGKGYYTVAKGDTLWGIARRYYGTGTQWTKIWNANKDMLIQRDKRDAKDPGRWIYPGQKLFIPN